MQVKGKDPIMRAQRISSVASLHCSLNFTSPLSLALALEQKAILAPMGYESRH
jgi:hypothetical protein